MSKMEKMRCPHCREELVGLTLSYASKRVLFACQDKEMSVSQLANVYSVYTRGNPRAGRKAVERLAEDGYLRRTRPGFYRSRVKMQRDLA